MGSAGTRDDSSVIRCAAAGGTRDEGEARDAAETVGRGCRLGRAERSPPGDRDQPIVRSDAARGAGGADGRRHRDARRARGHRAGRRRKRSLPAAARGRRAGRGRSDDRGARAAHERRHPCPVCSDAGRRAHVIGAHTVRVRRAGVDRSVRGARQNRDVYRARSGRRVDYRTRAVVGLRRRRRPHRAAASRRHHEAARRRAVGILRGHWRVAVGGRSDLRVRSAARAAQHDRTAHAATRRRSRATGFAVRHRFRGAVRALR